MLKAVQKHEKITAVMCIKVIWMAKLKTSLVNMLHIYHTMFLASKSMFLIKAIISSEMIVFNELIYSSIKLYFDELLCNLLSKLDGKQKKINFIDRWSRVITIFANLTTCKITVIALIFNVISLSLSSILTKKCIVFEKIAKL